MAKIIKSNEYDTSSCARFERMIFEERTSAPGVEEDPAPSVEEQVRVILEEARQEAERKVEEAYEEGIRRGIEEGRREFLDAVARSTEAIQAIAVELTSLRGVFEERFQEDMLHLVRAIVGRVLRRECWADPEAIQRILRAVLETLHDRENVTIRLNPDDLATIEREAPGFFDSVDYITHKQLLPDDALAPGECIVDTAELHIDARLDPQLETILDGLSEITCESPESR